MESEAKAQVPYKAICDAIERCETVGNPAVVEKRAFTVHVRKLPAAEGKGWIVRVIDKQSVTERFYCRKADEESEA